MYMHTYIYKFNLAYHRYVLPDTLMISPITE